MPTVGDLVQFLENLAPPHLAAEWDNVGLLLGERSTPVERVLTCLTVTPESAAEACERHAQLVVTHHPILFRGVKRLTSDAAEGRMLLQLARAGVAVYSPHTALDNTAGGINDHLASRLGLTEVCPLRLRPAPAGYKLVVFVPESDLGRVSDALFTAGAGRIGQYNECSFRTAGIGTFFGTESSNPSVGVKGRREVVSEFRIEVVCPRNRLADVVSALRNAHSYEEPAFDLYPLEQLPSCGVGRVGRLPQATPLHELAAQLRRSLGCGPVQLVGDDDRAVQRIAIACGAGGDLLPDALAARADVLLTGEMRFHDYLAARAGGIALVLPGHYATERCGVEELARRLQDHWPALQIWASRREVDPVTWI